MLTTRLLSLLRFFQGVEGLVNYSRMNIVTEPIALVIIVGKFKLEPFCDEFVQPAWKGFERENDHSKSHFNKIVLRKSESPDERPRKE